MLYAQSDRLWHLYLADVADMADAVGRARRDPRGPAWPATRDRAAALVEAHVRSFDAQVRAAVGRRLEPPLAQGTATVQRRPGAAAMRTSSVTNVASVISATAT